MSVLKKTAALVGSLCLLIVVTSGCLGGGSKPLGWSGATVSGDDLYYATLTGRLISLDIATGNPRWQYDMENAKGVYGSPLVVGDTVYIATYSGFIFAVNSAGNLKWKYPTDTKLPHSVVTGLVYDSGRLYYGSTDGKVYALDADSGAKVWEFTTEDKIWASPVVDDGVLYIGSFDNHFYALSADSGSELWDFEAEGVFTASAIIADNTVIIASLDRSLYALDTQTGNKEWQFTAASWFWATPVVFGDTIYAPNTDGSVYAINVNDGTKLKQYDMAASVSSSPVVVNGEIVVATQGGLISIIDPISGLVRKLADLEVTVRAPLAASGNIIYVHSQTNEAIYALDTTSGAQLWLYKAQ
ncbi:cell surface protein [Dehalogenimonas sp. WBC-2]|nr:cell surface protein [Dehalogenimonas sp. WBC-2]